MANPNQNQENLYQETLKRIETSPLRFLQPSGCASSGSLRQAQEDGAEDIYKEAPECP